MSTTVAAADITAPRPPGRPRDERASQAITEAALRQLAEIGYAKMSMESIATEAGVARATVYRRFRDKADLITAAIASNIGASSPVRRPRPTRAPISFAISKNSTSGFAESCVEVIGTLLGSREERRRARPSSSTRRHAPDAVRPKPSGAGPGARPARCGHRRRAGGGDVGRFGLHPARARDSERTGLGGACRRHDLETGHSVGPTSSGSTARQERCHGGVLSARADDCGHVPRAEPFATGLAHEDRVRHRPTGLVHDLQWWTRRRRVACRPTGAWLSAPATDPGPCRSTGSRGGEGARSTAPGRARPPRRAS